MSDHLAHQQLCKPKLLLLGVAGCSLWFTGVMHAAGFGYQLPLIGEELGASPGQTQWVRLNQVAGFARRRILRSLRCS